MRYRRLGRTELSVPEISLGAWAFGGSGKNARGEAVGWSGQEAEASLGALREAYAQGIRHWDTADVYGDGRSERLIGEVLKELPRDKVVLASKVGFADGAAYAPEQMARALEGSLRRLGTDYLDIYYFHHADFGPGDQLLGPALAFMRQAKSAGKIRFIGLSDQASERVMRVAREVAPDVVQIRADVVDDAFERSGLAAYCRQEDIGVAFFSVLRQGLWLGKYESVPSFPDGDYRNRDPLFQDEGLIQGLRALRAARLQLHSGGDGDPVLDFLVASVLARSEQGTVILGQRDRRQVQAAAQVNTQLGQDELAAWSAKYRAIIQGSRPHEEKERP